MAEYDDGMSDIMPVNNEEEEKKFKELHEGFAKKLHIAELPELERFKSIMDRLIAIETDIKLIKKHFNIVHIID